MIITVIFIVSLLAVVFWYTSNALIIIPGSHQMLTERLGTFARVLKPGFHLLLYPVESVRAVDWSYVNQRNQTKCIRYRYFPTTQQQMDVPPLQCITKDHQPVTIDVTLWFRITNVQQAVYYDGDALNAFYQWAMQTMRSTVAGMNSANLTGKESAIETVFREALNTHLASQRIGLQCSQLVFQNVLLDPKVMEENRDLHRMNLKREQQKEDWLSWYAPRKASGLTNEEIVQMYVAEHSKFIRL